MPSLNDSLASNVDMSGYTEVGTPSTSVTPNSPTQEPGYSPYTRTILPILSSSTSDNLRTYYQNGVVPQNRLLNPPPPVVQAITEITNQVIGAASQPGPSSSGLASWSGLFSSPGYIIFPFPTLNPFCFQWGMTPTPVSSGLQGAITFPIPFAANPFGIQMTTIQVSGQHTSISEVVQGSPTTTQFTWTNGSATSTDGLCPAFWIAWGQVPGTGSGGSGGGGGSTTIPIVIFFSIPNGNTGSNVALYAAAPRTGKVTTCVVTVTKSDPSTNLTFKILKNGTDVFGTDPTVAAGATAGTTFTFATLTSSPLSINAGDVFNMSITSGTANWEFTAQLE